MAEGAPQEDLGQAEVQDVVAEMETNDKLAVGTVIGIEIGIETEGEDEEKEDPLTTEADEGRGSHLTEDENAIMPLMLRTRKISLHWELHE